MPELDLRNSPWNQGIAMNQRDALKEIYYLLAIFWGSKGFDQLDELYRKLLRVEFQETEVNRILITLAVSIRNSLEQDRSRAEINLEGYSQDVGLLKIDIKSKRKSVPLKFREACNKLIHCNTINYSYRGRQPLSVGNALIPRVHLYGQKHGAIWKATLDIVRFCELATLVL